MFRKVPSQSYSRFTGGLQEQLDSELSSGRSTSKGNLDLLLFQSHHSSRPTLLWVQLCAVALRVSAPLLHAVGVCLRHVGVQLSVQVTFGFWHVGVQLVVQLFPSHRLPVYSSTPPATTSTGKATAPSQTTAACKQTDKQWLNCTESAVLLSVSLGADSYRGILFPVSGAGMSRKT